MYSINLGLPSTATGNIFDPEAARSTDKLQTEHTATWKALHSLSRANPFVARTISTLVILEFSCAARRAEQRADRWSVDADLMEPKETFEAWCRHMFEHSSLSEDVEHLKGLDPSFSSQVDLVLCASDCSHVVGFPVHSVIISSHSPVLSQFIQELHKEKDSTKQQLPRFPTVDDDCSAIRNMLKCMYGGLPRANSQQAVPRFSQGSEELETIPIEASKTRLTHKYGMLAIKQEQEILLLPPLHQLVHATVLVSQAGKMCTSASNVL